MDKGMATASGKKPVLKGHCDPETIAKPETKSRNALK
jgi:hypothetical protein